MIEFQKTKFVSVTDIENTIEESDRRLFLEYLYSKYENYIYLNGIIKAYPTKTTNFKNIVSQIKNLSKDREAKKFVSSDFCNLEYFSSRLNLKATIFNAKGFYKFNAEFLKNVSPLQPIAYIETSKYCYINNEPTADQNALILLSFYDVVEKLSRKKYWYEENDLSPRYKYGIILEEFGVHVTERVFLESYFLHQDYLTSVSELNIKPKPKPKPQASKSSKNIFLTNDQAVFLKKIHEQFKENSKAASKALEMLKHEALLPMSQMIDQLKSLNNRKNQTQILLDVFMVMKKKEYNLFESGTKYKNIHHKFKEFAKLNVDEIDSIESITGEYYKTQHGDFTLTQIRRALRHQINRFESKT